MGSFISTQEASPEVYSQESIHIINDDSYFSIVPQELIHLLISYLDKPLVFIETFNLKIKNRHWEQILSYKYIHVYARIKNLMKIDPNLKSSRYTKHWKDMYLNMIETEQIPEGELMGHGFEILPEIENLTFSDLIFQKYPQFYSRLSKLPGIFNRRYLYETLEIFVEEIEPEKIEHFNEYWKSGLLKNHIVLDMDVLKQYEFPKFILLFMLEDFPDIVKSNYTFIRYTLYLANFYPMTENYVVRQILLYLPKELLDIIYNDDDRYEMANEEFNKLIDNMRTRAEVINDQS